MDKIKLSHTCFLALISIGLSLFWGIVFSTETYADCIGSAQSTLGADYVNTFITAFSSRCSNISDTGSYGLVVPTDTNFPETNHSGSFSFSAQRIVYTKNRSGDDWGGVMSLSSAIFSASRLSCTVNKSGWHTGGSMTVTIPDASVLSSSSGDDGIVEDSLQYVSCLLREVPTNWTSVSQCKQNSLYFKAYKITYPGIYSQTVSYGGKNYTNATSQSNPLTVEDGQIIFSHRLNRNDTWNTPANPTLSDTYTIKHTGGTTSNWTSIAFSGKISSTITDTVNISSLNLQPNIPKEVCSTITYRNVKSLSNYRTAYNDHPFNSTSSAICVWVKDDRIFLTPNSRSTVGNGISGNRSATTGNTETQDSYGGSRGTTKTFTFSFTHQLKVAGSSSYSRAVDYYVERSTNGGASWSAVPNEGTRSAPKTLSINGNDSYVTAENNSWVSDPISQGSSTPTVCERITFRPKQVEVKVSSGVQTVKDNSWQTSTVCSIVRRRKPKSVNITAESHAWVDGANKDATQPVYSANNSRSIQFKFDIKNSENSNRSLATNYDIERIVYPAGDSEDWSKKTNVKSGNNVKTPTSSSITDTFNIAIDPGASKVICERIKLNPYQFKIHLGQNGGEEGSPESIAADGYFAKRCVTIARPALTWRNDGDIEVYSESSGALDNPSQTGGQINVNGTTAYLMKGQSADITYTHKLWRTAEKHIGDGTHQAAVTSPAEDVTVEYRFADPAATFSATSIKNTNGSVSLPSRRIATNTKNNPTIIKSNQTDPLLNTNTVATADEVGRLYEQCQTISYLAKNYTLQGRYWEVNGQIYGGNPNIQAVGTPMSRNNVGKSAKGCVRVIRPWNFKATKIEPTDRNQMATAGSTQEYKFQLTVGKNKNDYQLTDIPNATIQFVGFVISGTAGGANFHGNLDTASTPCALFQAQTGAQCSVLETRSNQNMGPNGASANGKSFYNDSRFGSSRTYQVNISKNNVLVPNGLTVGQKYCVAVGIKPANSGDGFNFGSNWAISDASCSNIGKKPNFQAWGGSISTNGGVKTSLTTTNGKTYGSWSDFAIIANKTIENTASGASLISGLGSYTKCKSSKLTIANNNCSGTNTAMPELGGAGVGSSASTFIKKISERYLSDVQKYINITDNPEINSSTLHQGSNPYVIFNSNPNKSIYISSDITVSTSSTSYTNRNLPQVIIISKGDIVIDQIVTNIDAWIIAEGDINTCVDGSRNTPALNARVCNRQLKISGPVFARKVYFNRTGGSDSSDGSLPKPAEIVDLSPSIYLFTANEAAGTQPVTTHLQKLPPRF